MHRRRGIHLGDIKGNVMLLVTTITVGNGFSSAEIPFIDPLLFLQGSASVLAFLQVADRLKVGLANR